MTMLFVPVVPNKRAQKRNPCFYCLISMHDCPLAGPGAAKAAGTADALLQLLGLDDLGVVDAL